MCSKYGEHRHLTGSAGVPGGWGAASSLAPPTSELSGNIICHQGIRCDVHVNWDGYSKRPVCCFVQQPILHGGNQA
jgi:hypothetical protein